MPIPEYPKKTSNPQRPDRRVLRTRHALREALISLIKEKDYTSITVEEITERAGLGRTTFYLHYQDKEDLLLEEFSGLVHELAQQIAGISIAEWGERRLPQRPIVLIFQHVAANEEIYRLILGGEGMLQAVERFGSIFLEAASELAQTRGEVQALLETSQVSISFLAHYFSGALLATILWWLEQELQSPPEEIASLFQQMFMPGVRKVVGVGEL